MQSSSHSCPIEINAPLLRSLKAKVVFALGVSRLCSGSIALAFGAIMVPFATATFGEFAGLILLHICKESLLI